MESKIYPLKQYKRSIELKKQGLGSLKISKILGIKNRNVIEGWINKGRNPLCVIRKNTISHKELIKNIEKAKKNNLEDLSHIIGIINGDGHLQIRKDNSGEVSFYSKYINEIKEIDKKFQSLFGIKGHMYPDNSYNRKRYKIFFASIELSRFLESMGVVRGKKTENKFLVPSWIIKGNKRIKSYFLRGIFSTEGGIIKSEEKRKIRYRIGISQYKNSELKENCRKYLEQIKNLTEEFGIVCSNVHFQQKKKWKNGKYTTGFKFTFEERYLNKFHNHIGFDNNHKTQRLLEVIHNKNKTF